MSSQNNVLNILPQRLKEARKTQGLSLDAVASLSGVSRSMVSQIERGESSPTIATLWNLTRALNIDFGALLEDRETRAKIDVVREPDVPTVENVGINCKIKILSLPEDTGSQEIYDVTFGAGGSLKSKRHGRGTVELISVLEGNVCITSGEAVAELSLGDTARYAADVDHEIISRSDAARVFLVVKQR